MSDIDQTEMSDNIDLDLANKKKKQGQMLLILGVAIFLVIRGIILFNKSMKSKKQGDKDF